MPGPNTHRTTHGFLPDRKKSQVQSKTILFALCSYLKFHENLDLDNECWDKECNKSDNFLEKRILRHSELQFWTGDSNTAIVLFKNFAESLVYLHLVDQKLISEICPNQILPAKFYFEQ